MMTYEPPFVKGDKVSYEIKKPKKYGIGGPSGKHGSRLTLKGEVVYLDGKMVVVRREPAGWRESYLLSDIRDGHVKMTRLDSTPEPDFASKHRARPAGATA